MVRCMKCNCLLSASADSGTMCAKCLKEKQDSFNAQINAFAYPYTPTDRSGQIAPTEFGLTKREWFAGMAMQGILSNPTTRGYDLFGADTTKAAYKMADAMLKMSNEETK